MAKKQEKLYFEDVSHLVDLITMALDRQASSLAEVVRERVIIPICKKRGMIFWSGTGRYFFERVKDKKDICLYDAEQLRMLDVIAAYKMLDLEITNARYLGYYVSMVRESDLE